jgi:hypothetical protein
MLSTQLPILAGLGNVQSDFVNNWIGPLFLILVAALSITFLIRREFRVLFGFLAIAIVVGLLIFFGNDFFGNGGQFTNIAKNEAGKINTIVPYMFSYMH